MAEDQPVSALAGRIAAGDAEPITEEERDIVAGLRAGYVMRYGEPPEPSRGRSKKKRKRSAIDEHRSGHVGDFKVPRVGIEVPRVEVKLPRVEYKVPRVEYKVPRVEVEVPRVKFRGPKDVVDDLMAPLKVGAYVLEVKAPPGAWKLRDPWARLFHSGKHTPGVTIELTSDGTGPERAGHEVSAGDDVDRTPVADR